MSEDVEIAAVAAVAAALEPLDECQRNRVLRYARDRYGVSIETLVERFEEAHRSVPSEPAVPAA